MLAQHIPIQQFEHKDIKRIEQGIRKQKYFVTSMRYEQVSKNVFVTLRRVPESIVHGGQASFEVHTTDKGDITDIYLVA